jgi:predicted dehydrogenase
MDKIRVGMIGCDLHALYYAALMAEHDALVLRGDGAGQDRGQAAFFYHYTNYDNPRLLTAPRVWDFEIVRCWDPNRENAEAVQRIWGARVCDGFEDCSDDVDLVFIPDCNGDGSTHLELATPGLEKGVPTFVDKPLAYEYRDAQAILNLGAAHGAPVVSLSILRAVPQARWFHDRLQEVWPIGYGSIKGGGAAMAGHIHAISLAQHIFGAGVEAVEAMGPNELSFMHLDYGGKPDRPSHGVMLNCDSGPTWHCSFYVSAFGGQGAIHSGDIGDFQFPEGAGEILRRVIRMVREGQATEPREEMLENIAVATAARIAQREGRRVYLREVTGG